MVLLIPKTAIEALNIDTVERAIVFSALCLEIGEQNSLNSPTTSIEISPIISRTDSYLAISFSCPLNSDNYSKSGGGLFLNNLVTQEIEENSTIANFIDFKDITASSSDLIFPDYPNSFTNFEQYLVWYFFIYWASLETKFSRNISFDLSTEQNEDRGIKTYSLSLDLQLAIDLDTWLLGGNYIQSVKHSLNRYQVPNIEQYSNKSNILTNETLLNNNQLLDNSLSAFNTFSNEQILTNEQLLIN